MYNDDCLAGPEEFERMAKAYSNALKDKGFLFVSLNNENFDFLIDEVFDILFKLQSSYHFLNGFLGSDKFLELTKQQIEILRKEFNYEKNRAFKLRTNNTKCFLNNISLESKLLLKLGELAKKSGKFEEISSLCEKRILLLIENFNIEGIFNNLTNLSFN